MRLVWTPRALQEIEEIQDHIAEDNPAAAYKTAQTIFGRTHQMLSENPMIGRKGQIHGTRELVLAGTAYIVAYRVSPDQVEILFVQHGARQWPEEI